MVYCEKLVNRVRETISSEKEIKEQKMFGGIAFMLKGNMFSAVVDSRLILRINREFYTEYLKEPHIYPMDFTGKPMKGMIFVDSRGINSSQDLNRWLNTALNYIKTLPPKNKKMCKKIKVIAFDADDTLWDNEIYFRETEDKFCQLFANYMDKTPLEKELLNTEIGNLQLYGYGIKGFTLSLIETACKITKGNVTAKEIEDIIFFAKEMLKKPVNLLEGVEPTITTLKSVYTLILATKGDLKDQEMKLEKSGLRNYFSHIEVMTDKKELNYNRLLTSLKLKPQEFLMVGNSKKSDIIPVLNIGSNAIHIPYKTTWIHEKTDQNIENRRFRETESITRIPELLEGFN